MSWKDIVCALIVLLGVTLFLYGANYYNVVIGWAGFYFMVGGLFAEMILKVYESIRKKED